MQILLLFFILSASAFAGDSADMNAVLQVGLAKLYNLDYQSALSISDSVTGKWPKHPAGYLFKSIIHFYQFAAGVRNSEIKHKITENNTKTIAVAKRHENKVEGLFFQGAAYGNLSLFYGAESDWLKGLRFGLQAKSLHENVLKADPQFYDAYLCLGLFNYYGATLPKMFSFFSGLLGLNGDSDEGLEQLRLAAQNGTFSKVEAATFLGNFYLEQGNYEAAQQTYALLAQLYPGNPFYTLNEGRCRFFLENYRAAYNLFEITLSRYHEKNEPGRLMAGYFLGRIAMIENDFELAITRYNEIISQIGQSDMIQLYDGWLLGDAYFYKAECLEFIGETDSARVYYKSAGSANYATDGIVKGAENRLKHDGRSKFELKVERSINFIRNQFYEDGINGLKTIVAADDSSGEREKFNALIDFSLGKASFEQNQINEAENYFLRVVEANPAEEHLAWLKPTAHYHLAQCSIKQSQPEMALEFAEKVFNEKNYKNENRIRFQTNRLIEELQSIQ